MRISIVSVIQRYTSFCKMGQEEAAAFVSFASEQLRANFAELKLPNSQSYIGQIQNGEPSGFGMLVEEPYIIQNIQYIYIGQFAAGQRCGYGVIRILDGDQWDAFSAKNEAMTFSRFPNQMGTYVNTVSGQNLTTSFEGRSVLQIKRYEVLRKLGKGGCGSVQLVRRIATDELYAMKTVPVAKIHKLKEPEFTRKLDHCNVVKYYETFLDDDNIYIILEYTNGGDMLQYIESGKKFTKSEMVHIFTQLIQALQHVHSKKLTHRDIKCENILLNFADVLSGKELAESKKLDSTAIIYPEDASKIMFKLADFGLAKNEDIASVYVGTYTNSAPEMLQKSAKYTKSVDIWALGCVFYEIVTGKHPFYTSSLSEKQVKDLIQNVKYQEVEGEWKVLIEGMLAREGDRLSVVEAEAILAKM